MPRSMWKGAVSFGMVSIPVRMYLATESRSVSFRSLCPCHQQPIKQKRHCSVTDDVLEWKDVIKGYELRVHVGRIIQGSRITSARRISNELPPGPTTMPARRQVTGIRDDCSTVSTSRRLARCGLT